MSMQVRLRDIVEPIVIGLELELFDLQYSGATLSVIIDRPRPAGTSRTQDDRNGVDMAAITAVTRAVSRALDELDPIPGRYSLEVSSPGLERPLRTPAHFAGALGEVVSVKIKGFPGYDGPRRIKGELLRAGNGDGGNPAGASIDLRDGGGEGGHTIRYADIDKARTVFEWGGEPKPTKPTTKPTTKSASKSASKSAGRPAGKAGTKTKQHTGPAAPTGADTGTEQTGPADHGGSPESAGGSGTPQDAQTTSDDKKVTAT